MKCRDYSAFAKCKISYKRFLCFAFPAPDISVYGNVCKAIIKTRLVFTLLVIRKVTNWFELRFEVTLYQRRSIFTTFYNTRWCPLRYSSRVNHDTDMVTLYTAFIVHIVHPALSTDHAALCVTFSYETRTPWCCPPKNCTHETFTTRKTIGATPLATSCHLHLLIATIVASFWACLQL